MTAVSNKLQSVQGMGGKLNNAIRDSQKLIQDNQFFVGAGGGRAAKIGMWISAAVALTAAVVLAPATPFIAVVGAGTAAALGFAGAALEKVAKEREFMRQEHQQFVSQAKEFMQVLQKTYVEVKREASQEQRSTNGYSNADFVQYQQQREQQQLAQQQSQSNSLSVELESASASKPSNAPRLG